MGEIGVGEEELRVVASGKVETSDGVRTVWAGKQHGHRGKAGGACSNGLEVGVSDETIKVGVGIGEDRGRRRGPAGNIGDKVGEVGVDEMIWQSLGKGGKEAWAITHKPRVG